MIRQVITYRCPHCQSEHIVKNGVLNPEVRYTEAQKEQILAAYYERPSLRGIARVFGVARETVATWLKKSPTPTTSTRNAFARRGH